MTVRDRSSSRLMARRSWPNPHRSLVACSSPSSSTAAIPLAVAAVSRLAKRPRSGLALTRRTRPRQSSSEEDGSTSLEDRWRSPARRQRSGPVLLAAGVRSRGVTVTDRRLPSYVARLAGLATSSVSSVLATRESRRSSLAFLDRRRMPDPLVVRSPNPGSRMPRRGPAALLSYGRPGPDAYSDRGLLRVGPRSPCPAHFAHRTVLGQPTPSRRVTWRRALQPADAVGSV